MMDMLEHQMSLFPEIDVPYDVDKDGPRGLLPVNESTYRLAILATLNWARRVRNRRYGSDSSVFSKPSYPMYHAQLYRIVDRVFRGLSGYSLSRITRSSMQVADDFVQARKGNFERLRDCEIIPTGTDTSSVVYAALGCVANSANRLIKIGYTTQDLSKYLKGKRIQSDFELLASFPGGKTEEREVHLALEDHLVEGREWFACCVEVLQYLHDAEWVLEEAWHRVKKTHIHASMVQ